MIHIGIRRIAVVTAVFTMLSVPRVSVAQGPQGGQGGPTPEQKALFQEMHAKMEEIKQECMAKMQALGVEYEPKFQGLGMPMPDGPGGPGGGM